MDDGRRFGPFSDVDDAFDPQQVGALPAIKDSRKNPEGRPAHRCVADHAIGADAVVVKRTGYDALVFHGAADRPTGLLIEDGAVTFFDAAAQWGLTTDKATDDLESRFGSDAQIAVIGPAGENTVRFASIVSGRTHQAQRLGMGAVMGAKRLKAIVLKEARRRRLRTRRPARASAPNSRPPFPTTFWQAGRRSVPVSPSGFTITGSTRRST